MRRSIRNTKHHHVSEGLHVNEHSYPWEGNAAIKGQYEQVSNEDIVNISQCQHSETLKDIKLG